jgi:hypothetical protein
LVIDIFFIEISGYFSWKRAPQIPTRGRFVASPLAEGERNKVRGLRAEEYDVEMFKAACRNRTLTLPLSLMKGEAIQARPAHFMCLDARIG